MCCSEWPGPVPNRVHTIWYGMYGAWNPIRRCTAAWSKADPGSALDATRLAKTTVYATAGLVRLRVAASRSARTAPNRVFAVSDYTGNMATVRKLVGVIGVRTPRLGVLSCLILRGRPSQSTRTIVTTGVIRRHPPRPACAHARRQLASRLHRSPVGIGAA